MQTLEWAAQSSFEASGDNVFELNVDLWDALAFIVVSYLENRFRRGLLSQGRLLKRQLRLVARKSEFRIINDGITFCALVLMLPSSY